MPFARMSDPQTSHDAAESVENITPTKQTILTILNTPKTDEELVRIFQAWASHGSAPKASESGIRSRRADLVKSGRVIDTGERREISTGRKAIVWQVSNA
jgi:hypothetical protein